MFIDGLTTALRVLRKRKGYTFLVALGLVVGLWWGFSKQPTPEVFPAPVTQEVPPLAEEDAPKVETPGSTHSNALGMTFATIPAGTFQMGSPDGVSMGSYVSSQPVHTVEITQSFALQTTEVTQGQWEAVMGTTVDQQRQKADPTGRRPGFWELVGEGPDLPMYYVSWEEAQQFIERLNAREDGYRYRLPSEAEWEYAARAGTQTRYGWGDEEPVCVAGARNGARFDDDGACEDLGVAPVGSYRPNTWGLFDMHGNVAEMVEDWFSEDYYSQSPRRDPSGPTSGTVRAMRGGPWGGSPLQIRVDYRDHFTPTGRASPVGFRLARTPTP